MKTFFIFLIGVSIALPVLGQDASPAPTTRAGMSKDERVKQLLDYLEALYAKKTDSPDWVSRGMGVISLSRSPRESATGALMAIMQKDQNDVVRALAWQAMLARVGTMDAKTHDAWMKETIALADRNNFRGPLRVTLLNVLASEPADAGSRRVFEKIFTQANAWESTEIPTLDALGVCAAAWKDKAVIDFLLQHLTAVNDGVRAEYVLHAAGCGAKTAREIVGPNVFDPGNPDRVHPSSTALWAQVKQGCQAWYREHPESFAATAPAADSDAWKSLEPKYLPPPVAVDQINPDDPQWRQDLELGRVNLEQFQAVFVVDATGSMGDVLDWLKRDITKMMAAIQTISKQAEVGVTFYRDTGDAFVVKHLGLTKQLATIMPEVNAMTADGGGDIPEAVYDGLDDALNKNAWSPKRAGIAKEMIIVGDAPPHDFSIPQCMQLAKDAAALGVRIHAVKVSDPDAHNDLHTFDDIAHASGGTTIEAYFPRLANFVILDSVNGKPMQLRTIARPEAQLHVAAAPPEEHPGEKILTLIIADAMNPQYRDRVEPLVRTLLCLSEAPAGPEKRLAFEANTPTLQKVDADRQKQ